MGTAIKGTFTGIAALPGKVPDVFRALAGQKRDADGPVSVVGASRIGGQAVQAGSWLDLPAAARVVSTSSSGSSTCSRCCHWTAATSRSCSSNGSANSWQAPGPGRSAAVDLAKLMPVTFLVIIVLGGISAVTILADVVNPIANPFR